MRGILAALFCTLAASSADHRTRGGSLDRSASAWSEAEPSTVCRDDALVDAARAILSSHFDGAMGATAPASAEETGFQHLLSQLRGVLEQKTLDAMLAAQAIAHDDFDRAATQFRRVLSYQRPDGALPFLIYGPSADATKRWFSTDRTFFPGPAFWRAANASAVNVAVLAPPIAADVAWRMYRLAPFENAMGLTVHTTDAVTFLCDVYGPLRRLHKHIVTSRRAQVSSASLLEAWHPWETLSSFSTHWREPLSSLKLQKDYRAFVQAIPASAKARFNRGAVMQNGVDSVEDFYEPMMFLAACLSKTNSSSSRSRVFDPLALSPQCGFAVHDVEFNTLVLRSAVALAEIARVLIERSSVCPVFDFTEDDLEGDRSPAD
ncbi:hypothetical protein ATCC90586_000765 [Pythium insidiosum]|nr:hypothetical protein ATCC90586_000765 [Pythium insidiosum]